MIVVAAFEAPAVIAGLDDVTVMGQPIEQRGGHFGVAEHARPFAEGEIGGHDDGGALIEPADEVEEKLATGLGEGQIAEFIQHNEVHPGQMLGEPSLPSVAGLGLEAIDEVDYVEEAAAGTGSDAASGDGNGQVGFACAGAANQHDVALLGDEAAASKIIDECLIDRRAVELEVGDVLGKRKLGNGELVFDRPGLLLADLGVAVRLRWTIATKSRGPTDAGTYPSKVGSLWSQLRECGQTALTLGGVPWNALRFTGAQLW